jgi:hypothetical protein
MKYLLSLLIVMVFSTIAMADPAYTWDASPAEQYVDLYQVAVDGIIVADLVPNSWLMIDIADGNHTIEVRAHNAKGWGPFGAAVVFDLPYLFDVPTAPTGGKIIDSPIPPQ